MSSDGVLPTALTVNFQQGKTALPSASANLKVSNAPSEVGAPVSATAPTSFLREPKPEHRTRDACAALIHKALQSAQDSQTTAKDTSHNVR
jgi:hypothetical protein